jgi:ribosome-associated protein
VKERLLQSSDQRMTTDGVIVIKAQSHRTQEKNRSDAINRLRQLILDAIKVRRKRIPTRPGRAAKQKRLDSKKKRATLKKLRSKDYD